MQGWDVGRQIKKRRQNRINIKPHPDDFSYKFRFQLQIDGCGIAACTNLRAGDRVLSANGVELRVNASWSSALHAIYSSWPSVIHVRHQPDPNLVSYHCISHHVRGEGVGGGNLKFDFSHYQYLLVHIISTYLFYALISQFFNWQLDKLHINESSWMSSTFDVDQYVRFTCRTCFFWD